MSDLHLYPNKILHRAKPKILKRIRNQKPTIFNVEQHELEFSNGEKRTYECLCGSKQGTILVVAIDKNNQFLLIREYCGGREDYELAFPKGRLEGGETLEQAALRELQEETGYAARKVSAIKTVTVAPGYMGHKSHIMLAQDLYWQPLRGDEPEPIEIYRWSADDIDALLVRPDFTEARSIAALLLLKHYPQLSNVIEPITA